MSRHGVAAFPTRPGRPTAATASPPTWGQLRILVEGTQKAFDTCEPLLAQSGNLSAQSIGKFQQQMLAYAKSMRSHGISNVPDPNAKGRFARQFDLTSSERLRLEARGSQAPDLAPSVSTRRLEDSGARMTPSL